ncbi:unnamed protein product [Didymodactylos carnosus]|uniref:BHLH domain-containing protein n=1 Tax=Didymodactylos carnosus TaxID=1234261 RepID=A0A813XQ68_9BILA|nr:unnamed protein product [Didymodactylos carnosus]CAF0876565.1 unnamed protein product [Didymodactylos carnosus]CAF3636401.1 unnamed protein product [Didymodactylos carnosus]CAF3663371.1 unnamed protein product [Didymodactylos carnosus]
MRLVRRIESEMSIFNNNFMDFDNNNNHIYAESDGRSSPSYDFNSENKLTDDDDDREEKSSRKRTTKVLTKNSRSRLIKGRVKKSKKKKNIRRGRGKSIINEHLLLFKDDDEDYGAHDEDNNNIFPPQSLAQRHAANLRERKRMQSINDAFEGLRTHIPVLPYEKRLSKVDTLRLAIDYIAFLTDLLDQDSIYNNQRFRQNINMIGGTCPNINQKKIILNCHSDEPINITGHSLSWFDNFPTYVTTSPSIDHACNPYQSNIVITAKIWIPEIMSSNQSLNTSSEEPKCDIDCASYSEEEERQQNMDENGRQCLLRKPTIASNFKHDYVRHTTPTTIRNQMIVDDLQYSQNTSVNNNTNTSGLCYYNEFIDMAGDWYTRLRNDNYCPPTTSCSWSRNDETGNHLTTNGNLTMPSLSDDHSSPISSSSSPPSHTSDTTRHLFDINTAIGFSNSQRLQYENEQLMETTSVVYPHPPPLICLPTSYNNNLLDSTYYATLANGFGQQSDYHVFSCG